MTPLWARTLVAAERGVARVARGAAIVRDEILFAWLSPAERDALTVETYRRFASFAADGPLFSDALLDWERRLVESPHFPKGGRVLVGGTGAGREMLALAALGYEVAGFDPSEPLVEKGKAKLHDPSSVVVASYEDVVRAVEHSAGPLASLARAAPFDALIIGFGSLSHVTRAERRIAVLNALRRLAPKAPVILSYYILSASKGQSSERRARLRRLFARIGARYAAEPSDAFSYDFGFVARLTPAMIETEAAAAGYQIAIAGETPFGHALLVPLRS